ncbi:hypothetical protein M9458_033235, partial [Cirrhinus mrigala]
VLDDMAQQPSIYKYLKKITKERSESSSLCDRSSQGSAPPPPKVSTVLHQLLNADGWQDEIIERNRDHIKVILDIVLTCAKQEIPLRGYRENDERKNAGNFLELFKLICKHNPDIQKQLDDIPSNAKMLSHDIQNEVLNAASTLLLRRIKKELHESEGTFYAILADECKDTSKKELVAVCLRYVYKGVVKERAIGLLDTDDMTAEGIAKMILEVVTPLELDPNLCVGFGFD